MKHGSEYEQKEAFLDLTKELITINLDSSKILLDSARNWISMNEADLFLKMTLISGTYCLHNGRHDLALEYYKKALAESLQTNHRENQLKSYAYLCIWYRNAGQDDSAIQCINKGLQIAEEINDSKGKALFYYQLAWVNIRKNLHSNALEYLQKSEAYYLELNDNAELLNVYSFIFYDISKYLEIFDMSHKYSKIAIDMANSNENLESRLPNLYNNLGVSYWQILHDYDSSRFYFQKANSLYKSNSKATNYFLSNLINLGGMEIQAGNPQIGLEYLNDALKIVYPLEDKYKICALKINIGLAYGRLQNVDSALYYLNDGIKIAEEISANEFMLNAYVGLYELDSIQGDYLSALQNFRKAQDISDKISSENVKNRIAELEIIHKTKEKR